MAIEIVTWIASIAKIAPALTKVLDTINTLMRKLIFVRKGELEQLRVLGDYIKYYLGSYTIHATSDKLIEIVNRYYTDLSDENSTYYRSSWETVEWPFRDIKEAKSMYINLILQRINYLDGRDTDQVTIYVDEFNKDYGNANTYLRMKNVKEFKSCIEDMSEKTLNLYKIFEDSISEMVNSLISIKRG
jgi:hypothetical protein